LEVVVEADGVEVGIEVDGAEVGMVVVGSEVGRDLKLELRCFLEGVVDSSCYG
jgi:hypothetical protein